jgi:hypothetical protein
MGSVSVGYDFGLSREENEAKRKSAQLASAQADWQMKNMDKMMGKQWGFDQSSSGGGSGGGNLYQDADRAKQMRMEEWETRRQAMEAANSRERAKQSEAATKLWNTQDKNKMAPRTPVGAK